MRQSESFILCINIKHNTENYYLQLAKELIGPIYLLTFALFFRKSQLWLYDIYFAKVSICFIFQFYSNIPGPNQNTYLYSLIFFIKK